MWNGYYYKVYDSWTSPLYWCPRWMTFNGYPYLTDHVDLPENRVSFSNTAYSGPSSGMLNSISLLTSSMAATGSLFQKLFETFVNEKEYLLPALLTATLSRQLYFDISNPTYAWIVENSTRATKVEVYVASGSGAVLHEITPADSDLSLFYGAEWKWKQQDNIILLTGMDLHPLASTVSGGWVFIDDLEWAASGACFFVEHPYTKNWSPLHISKVREDGLSGYYFSDNIRFRAYSSKIAQDLDTFSVRIDGELKTARRVQLQNSVDEKALFVGLKRRAEETNATLGNTILNVSWFRGQNERKFKAGISAALRQGELQTISASASAFTFPASTVDFVVRDIEKTIYSTETLYAQASGNGYYTRIEDPSYGTAFVRDLETTFTSASGIIEFDTYINNVIDRPVIDWKLPYYTQSGSTVTITDNYPHEAQDFVVFFTKKVDIVQMDTYAKKKAYSISPTRKWRHFVNYEEIPKGLGQFDF